ncbi:MAG: YesK family protein [Bacillus sp. (in: firmicutes)]
MMFIPLIVGIVVGIMILLVAISIRKKNKPAFARIPGYIGIVTAIVLWYIGYVEVRGFEGAAYLLLAVPIFILAIISLFGKNPKNNSYQF